MSSPLKQNTITIQELLNTINSLPEAGIDLPELTNEGVADDLVVGKELIDSDGNVITGTNPYEKLTTDADVATQADLIAQIQTALQGKAGRSGENIESEYYSSGIIEWSNNSNSITIPSTGPTGGLSLTHLSNNISTYIVTAPNYVRGIYSLYVGSDFKGYIAVSLGDSQATTGLMTDELTYDSTSGLVSTSQLYDYFVPGIYVYIVW